MSISVVPGRAPREDAVSPSTTASSAASSASIVTQTSASRERLRRPREHGRAARRERLGPLGACGSRRRAGSPRRGSGSAIGAAHLPEPDDRDLSAGPSSLPSAVELEVDPFTAPFSSRKIEASTISSIVDEPADQRARAADRLEHRLAASRPTRGCRRRRRGGSRSPGSARAAARACASGRRRRRSRS